MKKLNKVAVLLASLALAAPLALRAQTPTPGVVGTPGVTYQGVPAQPITNPTAEQWKYANGTEQWRDSQGQPWINGTNEYCWRDSQWTPNTAYPGCDGAAIPPPPPPPPAADGCASAAAAAAPRPRARSCCRSRLRRR